MFPEDRFIRARASAEQLAELRERYEHLSPDAQASYDAQLAPLSDQAIAELYLTEPAPEDEPEPAAPPPTPSSTTTVPPGFTADNSDAD